MGCALDAVGSWTGDPLIVDTQDLKTKPPSEIHVKRFNQKRWTFNKERHCFVFPWRTSEIFQEGQRAATLCNDFHKHFQKKVKVQILKLDNISGVLLEITFIGIRVLQGGNSIFPTTIFGYFLVISTFRRKQNKHRCPSRGGHRCLLEHGAITLSEPWISVTRFVLHIKIPKKYFLCVCLRQNDEETGHNMTRKHLARRMVEKVKRFTA